MREPPAFMFKDFHEALAMDEPVVASLGSTGRKTRNSNGSRLVSSRPGFGLVTSRAGLRSGKNYSKSDTDGEDGEWGGVCVCEGGRGVCVCVVGEVCGGEGGVCVCVVVCRCVL